MIHRVPILSLLLATALVLTGTGLVAAQNLKPDMVKKIDDALPTKPTAAPKKARKVLIYTYAAGFVHSSIPYGAYAVEAMGKKTGAYSSVISNDPAAFDDLSGYDAIVMVNTTGDWLLPRSPGGEPKKNDKDTDQAHAAKVEAWKLAKATYDKDAAAAKAKVEARRASIMKFINSGGGLVGFHAASDAQYNWKEFGLMIGGYFWGHPWHEKVGIKNEEPNHPLVAAFDGKDFEVTDEIYQFKEPYSRSNLRVLLTLDTSKTNMKKGGIHRTDGDFGVAWIRDVEKGRVFYSSLGHREEIYWNAAIMKFYLDGIQFALGDIKADATPNKK
ncbi:MAG: ThuA domain-containing protein [Phycisphaeraceae bacterium]